MFLARIYLGAAPCLSFFLWLFSRGSLGPRAVQTVWASVGSSSGAQAVVLEAETVVEVVPVICLFVDNGMVAAAVWCRVVGANLFVRVGLGFFDDRSGLSV